MNWFGKHWVTLYCKQKESSLKVSWMVVTCRYKGKQTFFSPDGEYKKNNRFIRNSGKFKL